MHSVLLTESGKVVRRVAAARHAGCIQTSGPVKCYIYTMPPDKSYCAHHGCHESQPKHLVAEEPAVQGLQVCVYMCKRVCKCVCVFACLCQ